MALLSVISVVVTSATVVIYGKAIWDPIDLTSRMTGIGVGVALIILTLDTMCCNLAANLVGPAYDFSSLWPKGISYRVGGMITATIAIVMMPWKILATTQGYIFTWLVGYSALLGPVAGILMVDYFLIRGTRLDHARTVRRARRVQLHRRLEYRRRGGACWSACCRICRASCIPRFRRRSRTCRRFFNTLYTYAWFVGLALASIVYSAWMKLSKGPSARVASA